MNSDLKKSILLHKYIPFYRFVEMIELQRLYLTNMTLWKDPYEGLPLYNFSQDTIPPEIYKMIEGKIEQKLIESQLKMIYAQSWTYDNQENDAMWRIYSPNKRGVRITVNLLDVERQIENSISKINSSYEVNHYKVKYGQIFDLDKIKTIDGVGCILTDKQACENKRSAFKHEKEYRFSFNISFEEVFNEVEESVNMNDLVSIFRQYDPKPVIHYSFPTFLLEAVVLDPRASKDLEDTFIQYCKNRNFQDKGISFKKSVLYDITK